MIEIVGSALNQWDVGRVARISGIEAEYAHFANKGDSKAVIMEIVDKEAKIPDYLLQTGKQVCVYAVKDGITVESNTFFVSKRERPEYYIYDDDERNFIYKLISNAEKVVEDANRVADRVIKAKTELEEQIDSVPGKSTEEGGEIFNDYENNQALAPYATAEGYGTIAAGRYQHAQGKYNVGDSEKANIVGGGTSDTDRKNIYALDWDGNAEFAGDVYVGPNKEVLAKRSETAPAGFGLGGGGAYIDFSEVDNIKKNGWYACDSGGVTICGIWFRYVNMRVDAWDSNNLKQTLYPVLDGNVILMRECYGSAWNEWECVNPPMVPSVEYRTIESYQGKAVYTKLIAYGALPSSAIKNVETGIDTITEVVRINGYVTDSNGSVWNALLGIDGLSDVWISHSDAGKYVGILTTKDMGDRTATIQLWYTKD